MSNSRKIKPSPGSDIDEIPYREALTRIVSSVADRTAYVVGVPSHMIDSAADRLQGIYAAEWYFDIGAETILRARSLAAALTVWALADMVTAVVTISKTVPSTEVQRALGEHVPADGSKDLIVLGGKNDRIAVWPRLLTDAIAVVDPLAAAELAANDIRHLS